MNPHGSQVKQSQGNTTMGNTKNVTYIQPFPEMFNGNMQPTDSIPANKWRKESALKRAIRYQKTPYADPTQISKGQTTTTGGGSFALYDKTGGTALFSYNPTTGVITINGSLVSNVVNSGTYQNIVISGNNQVNGTFVAGNYEIPQITGGTVNPLVYQAGGTPGVSGSVVYVKSVNFAGSVVSLGTLVFSGGLITSFS